MNTNYREFTDLSKNILQFSLQHSQKNTYYSMKITIGKFQQLYAISQMEMDELDKSILLVQTLLDKSQFEVETMKVSKFNKVCAHIGKSFELFGKELEAGKPKQLVKVNGRWYFLNYEITKKPMNAGRYVEVATFSTDVIGNLHKILASMANPMELTWKGFKIKKYDATDHEQIAEDMLQLDFKVAYHAAVFFCALFTESMRALLHSLELPKEKKEEANQIVQNLTKTMGGFIQPKWSQNLKLSN